MNELPIAALVRIRGISALGLRRALRTSEAAGYDGMCMESEASAKPGSMTAKRKPATVVVPDDPAGLDKVLLAACKGVTRFLESLMEKKLGRPVVIWDGEDGLGKVLEEQFKGMGVPNKRLPELVTPRSVLEQSGVLKRGKRGARRIKG